MAVLGAILLAFLAILVILSLASWMTYNAIVRSGLRADEAWSAIDVQLKRRTDLVPNLVETVRGYAAHEQDTLSDVIRARGALQEAHGAHQSADADNILTQALGRLFAVVEAYPQLKAADNFMALQKDLFDIEEKIAYARQFYNRNVLDFNTRIHLFPQSILAAIFGFRPREFFEAQDAQSNPVVSFKK